MMMANYGLINDEEDGCVKGRILSWMKHKNEQPEYKSSVTASKRPAQPWIMFAAKSKKNQDAKRFIVKNAERR